IDSLYCTAETAEDVVRCVIAETHKEADDVRNEVEAAVLERIQALQARQRELLEQIDQLVQTKVENLETQLRQIQSGSCPPAPAEDREDPDAPPMDGVFLLRADSVIRFSDPFLVVSAHFLMMRNFAIAVLAMLSVGSFADESMQALAADDESASLNLLQHKGSAQVDEESLEAMTDPETAVTMSTPGIAFLEEGEGRFQCGVIYCASAAGNKCCREALSAVCCGP
ncbi:unnamed protein product, partial [Symbiodinium necroappetens]